MSSPTQSAPQESQSDADRAGTVHISCTVAAPVDRVWEKLISPAGTQALLGGGAALGSKGESWHSDDGSHGVVRSYHPLEQIRVSWHADDDAPGSLVDLHLVPEDGETRLDLVHEKVTGGPEPIDLRARWTTALERVASLVTH